MKAIISVSDKSGLIEFARGLVERGITIYSTGGTMHALTGERVPATSIADLTGFPEILGGRVKTLHPSVHAGILARRNLPEHQADLARHGISPIDLVVVNLYPFRTTIERPGTGLEEAIEQIDIGGVTLIRAAAKNFSDVLVVVDPADYPSVLEQIERGEVELQERRRLAAKAFRHTAVYDTHIAGYLSGPAEALPASLPIALEKLHDVEPAENMHQRAALYVQTPSPDRGVGIAGGRVLVGAPLSYAEAVDLDAALAIVRDFGATAVGITRWGGLCGVACGPVLAETYARAHAGDPPLAAGGCVAFNRPVDEDAARLVAGVRYATVCAPHFPPEAVAVFKQFDDVRLVEVDLAPLDEAVLRMSLTLALDFRPVSGGFLVQTRDALSEDDESFRSAASREPTLDEFTDLIFAWRCAKHARSHAVVLAHRLSVIGVGAGQLCQAEAVEVALRKAGKRRIGSVMAIDGRCDWSDAVEAVVRAGVTALILPEGSIRDEELVRDANRHHLALVFARHAHVKH
ncbi:MAG: bifunctional phosphoribosylaminoimidazolecarboxamide formyltransferase/IMP cyclohydrolase [Chloroflexi bacterium]|nr:bifunctional phosphoribosylaminoimidazolecarboxamide formyltransferase/IMP cyclohydrolase [Chloroflexota bacterium]